MSETAWDEAWDGETPEPAFELGDEDVDPGVLGLEEQPEDDEPLAEDALGLLHLGRLTAETDIRGHKVRLRTLKIGEELEIGILVKPYTGTPEEGRAYACAVVAASIDAIDGRPLVTVLGPDADVIAKKFDVVRSKMYWPVINDIYEKYITLQQRQLEALEDVQGK